MEVNDFFKKPRVWFIGILFVLFLGYVTVCYFKLSLSEQPQSIASKPSVERGSIRDRNGKPLAVQTSFYHFGISPNKFSDAMIDDFAQKLAPVLEMADTDISARIRAAKNLSFLYIKKKLTQDQYEEVKSIVEENSFPAVRFDRIPGRVYPENDLASQLIGYMGDDGEGLSGIEYSQQLILSPLVTADQQTVFGQDVYLTIDANLQYKLEKIAKQTLIDTEAESMMLLAADAKTGEILSYISLPSINLNDYANIDAPDAKRDSPAINSYEPGSVFKIFTAAAYIDSGAMTPATYLRTTGSYKFTTNKGETFTISCHDPHEHGLVTVREALARSCNDAFAQMSERLDTGTFLTYIKNFGFGEKTGVELPREESGKVKSPGDATWSGRTKATISIGQEVSVTALQMLQAAMAIANKGVPAQLTVIKRISDKDGVDSYEHTPQYRDRVLKTSTADYIISCMRTTVLEGTGWRAGLDDISIGDKTGTAQIFENGRYLEDQELSSCMGIFPIEDPQIVLYTVIVKSKIERNLGGQIAAPVIRQAADEIIDHLGMTRDTAATVSHSGVISISENEQPSLEAGVVPNLIGRPKRDLVNLLSQNEVTVIIHGSGWVVRQTPQPGTPLTENTTIELYLE